MKKRNKEEKRFVRRLVKAMRSEYQAQLQDVKEKHVFAWENWETLLHNISGVSVLPQRKCRAVCKYAVVAVVSFAAVTIMLGARYADLFGFEVTPCPDHTDIVASLKSEGELSDDLSVHYMITKGLEDFELVSFEDLTPAFLSYTYESSDYTLTFMQMNADGCGISVNTEGYELEKYSFHRSEAYYVDMTNQNSQYLIFFCDGYLFQITIDRHDSDTKKISMWRLSKMVKSVEAVN